MVFNNKRKIINYCKNNKKNIWQLTEEIIIIHQRKLCRPIAAKEQLINT